MTDESDILWIKDKRCKGLNKSSTCKDEVQSKQFHPQASKHLKTFSRKTSFVHSYSEKGFSRNQSLFKYCRAICSAHQAGTESCILMGGPSCHFSVQCPSLIWLKCNHFVNFVNVLFIFCTMGHASRPLQYYFIFIYHDNCN